MPLPDDVIASARLLADITGRLPRRPAISQTSTPKGHPMTRSQIVAYLLARFSEPSSYAGLGAALAVFGLSLSDSVVGQAAQFLAAGCGLAALVLKEKGVIQSLALVVALGGGLSLAACSPGTPLEVAACAAALQASGETDSGKLALLAAANPACITASADVVNAAVAELGKVSGGKPPQSW